MKKTIFYIALLTFAIILFDDIVEAQTPNVFYGDTAYIKRFSDDAKEVNFQNIFQSTDSVIIRVWDYGVAFSISCSDDTIIGEKIIYVNSNPTIKRKWNNWSIQHQNFNLDYRECKKIYEIFEGFKPNLSEYSFNTDSLHRRDGGIRSVIEYKIGANYLIITAFSNEQRNLVNSSIEALNLKELKEDFNKKLPKGYAYDWGGGSSMYYLTFFESLYYKLAFWKRF